VQGMRPTQSIRSTHEALAVFLLAPVLTGWLLVISLRSRRRVLSLRGKAQPQDKDRA
jgi:hypothetical protein